MPIEFQLRLKGRRKTVVISGVAGLVLLFAMLSLPNLLAPTLDEAEAEKWIRLYLKKEISNRQLVELAKSGLRVPDREAAKQIGEDLRAVDEIEFLSIEVKHFLVALPTDTSRLFTARAVLRGADGQEQTRYFSLSAESRLYDFFWVNEHSRLMWAFSI